MKKVSVVTVVLNDKTGIRKTIESILKQESYDYEYIIVDGGSTDGTVDVIKRFAPEFEKKKITYKYIIQSDDGVYDAMNKALNYTHGEYIIYMNSGDSFEYSNILVTVDEFLNGANDVVYGNTICEKNGWQWLQIAGETSEIVEKIPFCHQSTFTKAALVKEYMFNLKYKVCADYDMYVRMYLDGKNFKYVDKAIARFIFGGISSGDMGRTTLMENVEVRYTNGILSFSEACYIKKKIEREHSRNLIKYIIKRGIPKVILNYIFEKKYVKRGWKKID